MVTTRIGVQRPWLLEIFGGGGYGVIGGRAGGGRTYTTASSLFAVSATRSSILAKTTTTTTHIQRRTYLYLPTSWKELELRWLRWHHQQKQRTVNVKLVLRPLQDKWWWRDQYNVARGKFKARYDRIRDRARTKYHAAAARSRNGLLSYYYQRQKQKWLLRKAYSVRFRNRVWTKSRNWSDRMQRAWNRGMVKMSMRLNVTIPEYSEPSWFCTRTGRPITSRDATGRFVNPWLSESTGGVKTVLEIAQWRWERTKRMVCEFLYGSSSAVQQQPPAALLEQKKPSSSSKHQLPLTNKSTQASESYSLIHSSSSVMAALQHHKQRQRSDREQLKFTWIGHATCLLQHGINNNNNDSVSILTDPIFSTRASPFQNLPIGVARQVPAAAMEELPAVIDVVLISHDHYDHLDKDTVLALQSRVKLWIVPTGIKEWLLEKTDKIAENNIIELEWWESVKLQRRDNNCWEIVDWHSAVRSNNNNSHHHPALTDPDVQYYNSNNNHKTIWILALPAQHWSSRTLFDRNFRLWCSFTVFLPGSKFFFGGDTALPEHFPLFDQIRDYVGGSIDLAALPIGAYEPAFFMRDAHMNPEEAVTVHRALDAKQSVGIHWGTFALSEEHMDDPPQRLQQAAAKAGVNFCTVRHGESVIVDCRSSSSSVLADDEVLDDDDDDDKEEEDSSYYRVYS